MTFEDVKQATVGKGKTLPLIGENDKGEAIFVNSGINENGAYYVIRTAQENGRERVNVYYKNGDAEEYFDDFEE